MKTRKNRCSLSDPYFEPIWGRFWWLQASILSLRVLLWAPWYAFWGARGVPGAILGRSWRLLGRAFGVLWTLPSSLYGAAGPLGGAQSCFEGPNVNSDHACYGLLTSRRSELEV